VGRVFPSSGKIYFSYIQKLGKDEHDADLERREAYFFQSGKFRALGRIAEIISGEKINEIKKSGKNYPKINEVLAFFALRAVPVFSNPAESFFVQGVDHQNSDIKSADPGRRKVAAREKFHQRHHNSHDRDKNAKIVKNVIGFIFFLPLAEIIHKI